MQRLRKERHVADRHGFPRAGQFTRCAAMVSDSRFALAGGRVAGVFVKNAPMMAKNA